jgi:Rieske Fe-S protein
MKTRTPSDRPSSEERDGNERFDRRRALGLLGGITACAAATAPLAGLVACAGDRTSAERVGPLRIPLGELSDGGRLRVMFGDDPVELTRTGDEVVARSLWCTHWGCEVRWFEGDRVYRCPCHDGVYDERGRVMTGPPPRSMTTLSARIEGLEIVVEPPGATA